jgi:hypothetical protein
MSSRELFLKKADRMRVVYIGAGVAVVGAVAMFFLGGIGAFFVLAGAGLAGFGVVRSRAPVVTIDDDALLLSFVAPQRSIPLSSIIGVDTLSNHDVELRLQNGAKVLVPVSKIDDEDGVWLRKALRKQARVGSTS